jgi:opacity protein-like surface antigen
LGVAGIPLIATAGPYDRGSWSLNDSPYLGVSAGALRYDEEGLNPITPSLAFARVGIPIAQNLAIEGRVGTGVNSADDNGYSIDVRSILGGYLKGSLPISPVFSLYGLAGVGRLELHRNFGDSSSTDTGFSFGVGADFNLRSNVSLSLEWTRLPGGNNAGFSYDSNVFTAGVNWHL